MGLARAPVSFSAVSNNTDKSHFSINMTANFLQFAVLAAGIGIAGICQAQTSSSTYQFTDLGDGFAYGMNDAGTVVGYYPLSQSGMIWTNGFASVLPQSYHGYGISINNQGEIVGTVISRSADTATIWQATPTGASYVGSLAGPAYNGQAFGEAVNNAGVVVGGSNPAIVWHGTTATALGNAPGGAVSDTASAINASGTIVGYADGASGPVAVKWNGTTASLLPALNWGSNARGINDAGVIVGTVNLTSDNSRGTAAEWKGNNLVQLGSLGGSLSQAYAINNQGQVVGMSTDAAGTSYATLWNGTTAINLNAYLPPAMAQAGWVMSEADAINNNGWIAGDIYNASTMQDDVFLLKVSPVPEPASWAMLLLGLGAIGTVARRKRI